LWIDVRCEQTPAAGRNRKIKCGKVLLRTNGKVISVKCPRCGNVSTFSMDWLSQVAYMAGEWGEPARVPHRCRQPVEPTMELCDRLLFVADGDGVEIVCQGDKCKGPATRLTAEQLEGMVGNG